MKTYTIQRFGLFSLLKYGCVTGLIVAFPIVSFIIFGIWRIAISLLDWLMGYEIVIPLNLLLINDISISAAEVLRGWQPLDYLHAVAEQNLFQIFLYILIATFLVGVWTALVGFISGLAYNVLAPLTGGLRLNMSDGIAQANLIPRTPPILDTSKPDDHQSLPASPEKLGSSHSAQMGPYLEIISPLQQIIPIRDADTLIGSNVECAISLEQLQPRHAQLTYEEGRYILRDFSQGKTLVQGHVVDGLNMIKDGFQIQLGPYRMIFRYGS